MTPTPTHTQTREQIIATLLTLTQPFTRQDAARVAGHIPGATPPVIHRILTSLHSRGELTYTHTPGRSYLYRWVT